MARRKVFWHIGPDDLGTRFVTQALDAARESLAEHDVLVAGTPAAWELATAELRRSHQQAGFRRAEVEGQNATLVRRLWKHRGPSVLSMPGLAGATKDQVALALDGLRGAEVHLVLVVRDLTSQVYAGAQAALESGGTSQVARFVERVLDEDGREQEPAFWAGHDLPAIVRRWSRTVLPEHVHVVAESDPARIWSALTALLDADVPLPEVRTGQLDLSQLEVLRDVVLGVDGRLDARGRRLAVRDLLSDGLLPAAAPDFAPVPGADLVERWREVLTRKGYDVHGELRAVAPTPRADGASSGEESVTAALAEALVEVARLRRENADLVEENLRLDRKRRKHKRRVKELSKDAA